MIPLIDGVKECRLCKVTKPISEYHPNKQCRLGVIGTCRECYKPRINKWYSENRKSRQDYANQKSRDRKALMIEHFHNKCFDCEQTFHQCVYQFHHLDPSEKDVNPSKALTWSIERMWKELSKCVMLCANCHMIRHHGKEAIDDTTH